MKTQRKWLFILLAALLLTGCTQSKAEQVPEVSPTAEGFAAQAAVLEGEVQSPCGRFIAQTDGVNARVTAMGLYPAEHVQIMDAGTGDLLWEGDGAYFQSILWSPDGAFAALARGTRTAVSVTVIETGHWTSWDFALPDGSSIPEYTSFPSDAPWGMWHGENDFLLAPELTVTLGTGGDGGETQYYRCILNIDKLGVKGTVLAERREQIPGSYDFDHDGTPDFVELVSVGDGSTAGWYELWVNKWKCELHTSHAGWGSYFACRADGKDWLLRYEPIMYQGFANYRYQLFSLDKNGSEQVIQEGSVDFDINFGSVFHGAYDSAAIIDFLTEVHGLLDGSELLVTTESGDFRSGGSGAAFDDDLSLWTQDWLFDENSSIEENIRNMREAAK